MIIAGGRAPRETWLLLSDPLVAAAGALDRARRDLWWIAARASIGRRAIADRSLRLCLLGVAHVAVALWLTVTAPLSLLLVGPLVLGVPHVVSDLRFLLLRAPRPWGRLEAAALLLPLALMTALRVSSVLGGEPRPMLEGVLGAAAIFGVASSVQGETNRTGRALAGAFAGLTAICALAFPWQLALVLGHLHNLVALALWIVWLRGAGASAAGGFSSLRTATWVCSAVALGVLLIALGAGDRALAGTQSVAGLGLPELIDTLAPGLPTAMAARLVLVYAFLQAVHYALWVRIIPATLSPGPPAPGFRVALSSLRGDLGAWGMGLAAGAAVLLPLLAVADAYRTRGAYLSLVLFHGWLELAAGARALAVGPARA